MGKIAEYPSFLAWVVANARVLTHPRFTPVLWCVDGKPIALATLCRDADGSKYVVGSAHTSVKLEGGSLFTVIPIRVSQQLTLNHCGIRHMRVIPAHDGHGKNDCMHAEVVNNGPIPQLNGLRGVMGPINAVEDVVSPRPIIKLRSLLRGVHIWINGVLCSKDPEGSFLVSDSAHHFVGSGSSGEGFVDPEGNLYVLHGGIPDKLLLLSQPILSPT